MKEAEQVQREPAKPIFVVGAPRSGTSVLAWCLGQHPNVFPVPESNWMGDFAANVAIGYQIGAARGDYSIFSAMDVRDDELFAAFGRSIHDLILRHRADLQRKREARSTVLKIEPRWLEAASTAAGPKGRWVDGTPEYSLHIYALRKLFPHALFIHLFRDAPAVVRSMLNFHRVSGTKLVANEEEAYNYWLQRVKACLKAEQAYGPSVIHRLRYSTLVENPESAMRSLLDFVGEPYCPKCLEPLAERINSSNVPPDFKSDDPATDPAIVEKARRLSAEIEQTEQAIEASSATADELEAAFHESFLKIQTIEQELKQRIAKQHQHYLAEIEEYKSHILNQQQHYLAEIETYKSQISSQQAHYTDEIGEYQSQIARQGSHYTAEVRDYAERLRKQLRDTQKLASLLDEVAKTATGLRSSWFWRLAYRAAAIEAKFFHRKRPVPDGNFEKILARYSRWRASHPEIAKIDRPTEATGSSVSPSNSDAQFENISEIQSIHKVSGSSAEA